MRRLEIRRWIKVFPYLVSMVQMREDEQEGGLSKTIRWEENLNSETY